MPLLLHTWCKKMSCTKMPLHYYIYKNIWGHHHYNIVNIILVVMPCHCFHITHIHAITTILHIISIAIVICHYVRHYITHINVITTVIGAVIIMSLSLSLPLLYILYTYTYILRHITCHYYYYYYILILIISLVIASHHQWVNNIEYQYRHWPLVERKRCTYWSIIIPLHAICWSCRQYHAIIPQY